MFPLLTDLAQFLTKFRSTLNFTTRRALTQRLLASVRELHERCDNVIDSISTVTHTSLIPMSDTPRKIKPPSVAIATPQISVVTPPLSDRRTINKAPRSSRFGASTFSNSSVSSLALRRSAMALAATANNSTDVAADVLAMAEAANSLTVGLSVNTARDRTQAISFLVTSGPTLTSSISQTLPTPVSRVHGLLQASRFILVNGIFSDEWVYKT